MAGSRLPVRQRCRDVRARVVGLGAVTAVAVMLLGVLTFSPFDFTAVALYPLVLGAVAIVASIRASKPASSSMHGTR